MHFPERAASILFLSIFGHKIGVLKSPALFQGKELQVTRFKVTCFWTKLVTYPMGKVFRPLLNWSQACKKWYVRSNIGYRMGD